MQAGCTDKEKQRADHKRNFDRQFAQRIIWRKRRGLASGEEDELQHRVNEEAADDEDEGANEKRVPRRQCGGDEPHGPDDELSEEATDVNGADLLLRCGDFHRASSSEMRRFEIKFPALNQAILLRRGIGSLDNFSR